jgi:UPF0176 protein
MGRATIQKNIPEKIILFYKFTPVIDPQTVMFWQRQLCERYGLKGRIIISKQGINGTLGGPLEGLKSYVKAMNAHSVFKAIHYKWSEGGAAQFPRISIKVRQELVAFGSANELEVTEAGVIGGGVHLTPKQVHELVEERKDVVFFDGRNAYEAAVGRFKDAIVPDTETTRDFLQDLAGDKYKDIKKKPVVTYCTGGIRCEVLSVLMKNRGFEEVYQIDGGIVTYGKEYANEGLWEGKLYVFDERLVVPFSEKAEDIGLCRRCQKKTSNFINCAEVSCNKLVLICVDCSNQHECCSKVCAMKCNAEVDNVAV